MAASLSITCARRRRLASASSSVRSAAAVDRRSSHKRIGNSLSALRLRAKARVAWTRGPGRAVEIGRQTEDEAADLVLRRRAQQLGRVFLEFGAADDLQRRGDRAGDIGQGKAERLGAGVDADQRRPLAEAGGKGLDILERRAGRPFAR